MTEQVDLDMLRQALERDEREFGKSWSRDVVRDLLSERDSLAAELRQERERNGGHGGWGEWIAEHVRVTDALSCAEETIETVRGYADRKGTFGFSELHNMLAEYDRTKKEADRG